MWYFYAVALPVTLGMVIYTLQHFASPKVARHVRIVVGYAWFVNMSIVILVPLDVWTTIRRENSKAGAICAQRPVINVLWSLPYWSAFFLTWLIIPMMQGYEDAADFTMGKRLKTSIRGNLIFYSSVGVIGLVGAIILLTTKELAWDNLLGLAIGASNAFGLVTGALLLGFGLVEIPRGLWRHANLDERAKWLSHKVAKVAEKLDHAHQELSTAIVITQATSTQMSRRDRLRPMMDIIDAMASEDPTFKPSGGQLGNDLDYDTDEKSMAALRWRLRHAQEMYSRYKTEYTTVVWMALELEDTIKNFSSNDCKRFVSRLRLERKGMLALPLDTAEWVWRCLVSQQLMRLLALILGLMSVAIIFAEATMLSQEWVDLSLFSILIRSAGLQEEVVQLLVSIPLVYICVCTYFSVFKLGMFSFYYLVPHHTDSVSLLMNCSMVSRYAAPMCYNFLSLIHLTHYNKGTGKIENLVTCFEERMSVLPEEYERIYPLVMVVWCFLIASNVHNRILDVFGSWRRFRFESDGDVGEDDGASSAGLIILRRERASLERGLAIGENVVPLARHFANGDDLETNLPMLPGEVQGDKVSFSFHPASNGGKLPPMTGLYAALKESAPKLPAIVTRDVPTGKRPTTLRDTSHSRIANKYANLREGTKNSTRTSFDDLVDLNTRVSGRHSTAAGALQESPSSESIIAKPSELAMRPEARSPPMTSPRLGQESEGLLERQWDVMKSKLQGLAIWRTDSDPLSGDSVPRPAPNLDNIFEGLRANRRGVQEEKDDPDDTSYSLLRAAQKSSRENLHR